ncbi:hypothetical protein NC651_038389 [Populus alba x Populus x berolinensis]|nr:hypothetical protein NC651_038389 [Populus alba x Populus x berolinensis]
MSHSIELGLKWELDSHFHQIISHVWRFIQAQCIMALPDLAKKQLPSIPELDDPSFTKHMDSRDLPYNRSMQLKFTVLETLSFPERFHALRKGPFVAPGRP